MFGDPSGYGTPHEDEGLFLAHKGIYFGPSISIFFLFFFSII